MRICKFGISPVRSCCIYPIYRPAHWKQPDTYARFSDIVEESGIDGFSYSMDGRDKGCLDRNNEEARGEGSRAQGILSTSRTTTQCQGERKGTGVTSSEDEFELVMGIFEKVTHDKTPFLHTVRILLPIACK